MTINQLRYFVTVCELGKIRAAASALNISEPSLSNAIKTLESELDLQLFHRDKNRLDLTEFGKTFYQRASALVIEFDALERDVKALHSAEHVIHLSVPNAIGDFLFAKLIPSYTESHPNVRFDIMSQSSFTSNLQLLEGKEELAIINKMAVTSEDLEFIPLFTTRMLGLVRKDHPLAWKMDIPIAKFENEKLIFINERASSTRQFKKLLEDNCINAVFSYSARTSFILNLIENQNAIAFFSDEYLNDNNISPQQMSNFACFSFSPAIYLTIGIARNSKQILSPQAMNFYDYCKNYFQSQKSLSTNEIVAKIQARRKK